MSKPYTFFDDPIFDGIDIVFGRRIYNQLLEEFREDPIGEFSLRTISYKISDIIEEDTMIGVTEAGRRIVEDLKACLGESS